MNHLGPHLLVTNWSIAENTSVFLVPHLKLMLVSYPMNFYLLDVLTIEGMRSVK